MSLELKNITQSDVEKHFLHKDAFESPRTPDVNSEDFFKNVEGKNEISDGKMFKKSFALKPYKPTIGKPVEFPTGGRKRRTRRVKSLRKRSKKGVNGPTRRRSTR